MRKFLLGFAILMLTGSISLAQGRLLTGTIRDDQGEGVAFATITEAGTQNAVQADANGNYSIKVGNGARLNVSATGYTPVLGSEGGIIILSRLEGQLQEVVVTTAQGIKREKRSLGYAATTVGNADLTRGRSSSALNALQGKVAGVNITSTAGAPGSSSRIVIRGGSSITGNNQALLVVDGVPIENSTN